MKPLPADTAPEHHTAQTELPSEVASVDAARELDDRYRLGLAVHGAVADAVVHGNRQKPGTAVRLRWATRRRAADRDRRRRRPRPRRPRPHPTSRPASAPRAGRSP
ncbi:hypothetical protein [Kitasatospora purpeofusca]|uniref:hypothetical protein n=1 Tax=Kitasatospora purpeofusca TaxID=67352 RepID=UPI003865E1C3|nr:hypothetical protein OIP63_39235 [Kitasatospora purpeofusca]